MGRWAQRKRTGGGPPVLAYMREAIDNGTLRIDVEYSRNVNAAPFALASFTSNPSAQTADNLFQLTPDSIAIEFALSIAADTTLVYNGTIPGIVTPQTISH